MGLIASILRDPARAAPDRPRRFRLGFSSGAAAIFEEQTNG